MESFGTNVPDTKMDAGQMLLAQTLLGSDSPVTVIATGPLSNLAWALDNYPEVSSKIEKVLIMGASRSSPSSLAFLCIDAAV